MGAIVMRRNFRNRIRAGSSLALTLALAACGVPNLGDRPQIRPPAQLESARSLASAQGGMTTAWPQENWWEAYGDPTLNALVAEGLANSPSVAAAAARVRQATGATQVAGADGLPQISGEGQAGWTKQSYNNGFPREFLPQGWKQTGQLALTGDFDLDLWGRRRKQLAAATSEEYAVRTDADQARLLLASNIVSSYFDLARLLERDTSLSTAVASRESLGGLIRRRSEQGLENQTPVRQTAAETSRARVSLSANREQIAARRHALAALLGAGPDRGLDIKPAVLGTIQETALSPDAGIALAGRRPDIVAARLRAEAAGKRLDVAKTAYLPDISLRGLIGLTSLGFSNLFKSGSDYGTGAAAFSLPIFDGGRLRGQYRQSRGAFDLAVADYNQTVVTALREVADALASREAAKTQEQDARQARRDADAAFSLASQRYNAGLSNYIDVLSAQQVALEAREAAIDAHFRTLATEIALKRALGGGFAENSNEKVSSND